MMSQWQACKTQAKEALLLFRLGDFYEAFYEDAQIISKEIGLTLTARQGLPMCGVPFHTAEGYIDKLIAKGHKIAIAEQTEDPKAAKGLVKREIARIVTPGTVVNSQLLNDKKNNFFVAVMQVGSLFGVAALDLTTTEFKVSEHEKEQSLLDELCRLRPAEMLVSKQFECLKDLSFHFGFLANEKKALDPSLSADVLKAHFDVHNLDGFGLRNKPAAVTAAGTLLLYLKEELNLSLEHLRSIQLDALSTMAIDRSTMRNLAIDTTLIDLLDETYTPMGGRLIRQWLQYPLLSVAQITERQQEVEHYLHHPHAKEAREHLSRIRDLERLMMKISARYATARDVYALGVSLSHLPALKHLLQLEGLFDAGPLAQKILSSLNDSPPLRIGEGDVFKDGYNTELDQLRLLCKDSMTWMANYQIHLREQTGIKTLKVGYTKAFGYYIEVSRAQSEKIPASFIRRQTLVNAERFITQELKEFEHQVLTAEERSKALEIELFEQLRAEIAGFAPAVHGAAKEIAKRDVLLALAKVAVQHQWVRPVVDESDVLEIVEGRHPVIERAIGRALFIPNDTHLHPEQQLMLITGPNMAGKSTYIRQVALIVILAQAGSFVPARSARIGLVDKVFSRIGASDDLARGQSTFMVEMTETANILNNATSRSLVLLDEIGRGTSTYDGISIAWAVAEYLLTTHRKMAKTLFATHYWELTRLENEFRHAANFQTAVEETASGIVFLRKIVRGGTDKSYGIHVAKLAGLPPKVIQRAEAMLKELEKKPESQMFLFDLKHV
ncbi:MAG: DNA mismatch repair protein MutS [Verrucomicrobia bacterium]|nr:DNA mismatch repair protein MutS [Verrucomicrobiota bacterium]